MVNDNPNNAKPCEAARVLVPYREARHALGGISAPTLYKMLENGDLDRVTIGKRCFITAVSIDSYIRRNVGRPRINIRAVHEGARSAD